MQNVRLFYEKRGRAKYISHLDMNRLMSRVLKRSKIPVWYTQGFNPHIHMVFALPLSLGFESEYDIMDFRLDNDDFSKEKCFEMLKNALPESIVAVKIAEPCMKINELAYACFKVVIECDKDNKYKLISYLNGDEIIVEKTTKKKMIKTFNVKPDIKEIKIFDSENGLKLEFLLPCGNDKNINPTIIFESAWNSGIDFEIASVVRGGLFDKKMALFH